MGQSSDFGPTAVGKKPTAVGEMVAAFLRRRHPQKTANNVAAETGISADAVEKLLEWKLITAYGPTFVVECFPDAPGWLSDAAHQARVAEAEAALARAQAEISRLRSAVRP